MRQRPYFMAHPGPSVSDPPDSAVEAMAACAWAIVLYLAIYALSGYVPLPL